MKLRILTILTMASAALFLAGTFVSPVRAEGAESFDDALAILSIAIANDDMDALASIIHEDLGLMVGGHFIGSDRFGRNIDDETLRDLQVFTDGRLVKIEMSVGEFLRGEDDWTGAFTSISGVTLTHYEMVERGDLESDALLERWEHGELETAVVAPDEYRYQVYILPEMKWRLTFVESGDFWYLTDVDARI